MSAVSDDEGDEEEVIVAAPLLRRSEASGTAASSQARCTEAEKDDDAVPTLIVIDALNVGTSHGTFDHRKVMSAQGIKLAVDFFDSQGYKVRAFFPQNTELKAPENERNVLAGLRGRQVLVYTPSGAHDDRFIIEYAKKHDGYILSNDRYRDHVRERLGEDQEKGRELDEWLRWHRISFCWVDNELLPNPEFPLPAPRQAPGTGGCRS